MTRQRKGATGRGKSQAVKSVEKQVQQARQRAKKLLQNAGKDIRQVRSEVAALKKAGLVSSKIDARTYQPSRYMLEKIRKNADVLEGKSVAVKASKKVRRKYAEKGIFEERGGALIVPREYENQRTKISRGMVEISRELRAGEERRVILPFKATDMETVANELRNDPTLDGLKEPGELFGFRLFGHNMNTIGFPDASELADYILTHYQHLFKGKNGRVAVKNFELLKFKAKDSQLSEAPEGGKVWTDRRKRYKNEWAEARKRERDKLRKKKERDKETPEQRKNRLDKQRKRSAINRQRKWEEE